MILVFHEMIIPGINCILLLYLAYYLHRELKKRG